MWQPVLRKSMRNSWRLPKYPGVTIEFGPHDKDAHVGVKKTGCRVSVTWTTCSYPERRRCDPVYEGSDRRRRRFLRRVFQGNEIIERLLYQKGGKVSRGPEDIPFIAKQTRIVLKNCGKFDAESLNEYIASSSFPGSGESNV